MDSKDVSKTTIKESASREPCSSSSASTQGIEGSDIQGRCTSVTEKCLTKKLGFRTAEVETNYISLDIKNLPDTVYQYDVKFKPGLSSTLSRQAFDKYMQSYQHDFRGTAAFDGSRIFFTTDRIQKLRKAEVSVTSRADGQHRVVKVSIKETATIDMRQVKIDGGNPERKAIQCLEVILRIAGNAENLYRNTKGVYNPSAEGVLRFSDNIHELWIGLRQSFVFGEQPFLNVDISHQVFVRAMPLVELYENLRRSGKIDAFAGYLSDLKVLYVHPITQKQKHFVILRLGEAATKENCKDDNGNIQTIAEYYEKTLGYALQYPNYPVIERQKTRKELAANNEKKFLYPIECLSVEPLQGVRSPKLIEREISKLATTTTDERKARILNTCQMMDYKNTVINNFGIKVSEGLTTVTSHILNERQIKYGGQAEPVQVTQGKWRMSEKKFVAPGRVVKWSILNLSKMTLKEVRDFGDSMVKSTMNIKDTEFILNKDFNMSPRPRLSSNRAEIDETLLEYKKEGTEILFIIISGLRRNSAQYSLVKQCAELKHGILTQCILEKNARNCRKDVIAHLLLKLNAKLAGLNHYVLPDKEVPTESIGNKWMVISASISHPSSNENLTPSVVGVTASFDEHGFKYNSQWRLQSARREIIDDFEDIVFHQIQDFERARGFLPENILYYRDGVSQGQFAQVSDIELNAMKKACERMKCTAKITIIMVQKRHHTRFFPKEQNPNDTTNNNVEPGTVVDSKIVNPLTQTFFMVSHKVTQGVAKPTKYAVIYDDAKVPAEELQVFTYGLCHMFARCNRVMSYPAPTYYAHLMAYRGRMYITDAKLEMDNLQGEYENRMIASDLKAKNPMFFI